MCKRLIIHPGSRYGRLTAIREAEPARLPCGQINRMIECFCDCGSTKTVRLLHLVRGRISSCGCIIGEQHGESRSKIYNVWRGIKNRCYWPSCPNWHLYGGKGIKMCDEWKDSFICFRDWAISNGWKWGLHIDRINGDGHYEPNNCRFVTPFENSCNTYLTIRVSYKGSVKSLRLILSELGKSDHYYAIRRRIIRGWSADRAIDTPIREGNYKRGTKC